MNIIALVEVHPITGEESFISARFSYHGGEFDLPLSHEQAEIILGHSSVGAADSPEWMTGSEEPESGEYEAGDSYERSPVFPNTGDPDTMVIPARNQVQDAPQWGYDDDEL